MFCVELSTLRQILSWDDLGTYLFARAVVRDPALTYMSRRAIEQIYGRARGLAAAEIQQKCGLLGKSSRMGGSTLSDMAR